MIIDILRYFFLKKATYDDIFNILKNEGFVYIQQDIENILKGNQKGVRYGNVVLTRNENGKMQKRFLKIMIDGTFRTFRLFRRQVKVTNALNKDNKFNLPTVEVVEYSLNSRVPYAIFETREDGENFGFMHDNKSFYEKFSEKDMQNLVNTIYSFHNAGSNINKNVWKYTQNFSSDISHYKKQIKKDFDEKITHKSSDGKLLVKSVKELLEKYIGLQNIDSLIMDIIEKNWKYISFSQLKNKYYLVHADMQIDNIYRHEDQTFELLDFEWVGKSDNPVIAIMYDYGNLRARAWSSPSFQSMLDRTMVEIGKKYYDDINMINAGLTLGILRSGVMMSRFHLDFIHSVKKSGRSDPYYQDMYLKTLSAIKEILKK